jgi:imidazolonepropionase-like amidohydrolase
VHRTLAWMGRAGVGPWSRLRAATLWPARSLGGELPLQDASPANFVILADDPLKESYERSSVEAVCLRGRFIDRSSLKPDLVRRPYHPR